MPVYKFHYSEFPLPPSVAFPQGHTAYRPLIRLTLVNGTQQWPCYAWIDSGADYCSFPLSFYPLLALDLRQAKKHALNGVVCYFWNIQVDVQDVTQFPAYVAFTDGIAWNALGYGLLGQHGFLDRFNVSFKHSQGIFEIEIS